MRPLSVFLVAVFVAVAVAQPAKNSTSKAGRKGTSTASKLDVSVEDDDDVSSRQNSHCYTTQFQCSNGQCISKTLLCNGRRDCRDGSDESYVICYPQPQTTTTESSFYPLENQDDKTTKKPSFSCKVGVEFRCTSGECVNQQVICDGYRDCRDGSDEESSICDKIPSTQCGTNEFRCNNGQCINSGNKCDGTAHCSDNSDEDWNMCQSTTKRPTTTTKRPDQGGNNNGNSGNNGNNWQSKLRPCNVPPQPQNGRWRLHRSLCDSGVECSPPSNVRSMDPGSYLVYNCNTGFVLKGNRDVLCGPNGQWVHEPQCEEVRCTDLSSSAIEAFCLWNNVAVSCEVPAPVGTVAQLKCRQGFVQEISYTETAKNVTCETSGKWSPNPIQCVKKPKRVKLVVEGDMIVMD